MGVDPYWAKDSKVGYATINAMAETVETKPAFREAFRRRRCLLPVDNFYEWEKIGKERQPYAIALADHGIHGAGRAMGDVAVANRRDGAQLHGHHDRAERAMRADP
jgi:putative SOS response-associated peptidase YedK